MERISKVAHTYGGRDLNPGDPFEIEDPAHVPLLEALGRIGPDEPSRSDPGPDEQSTHVPPAHSPEPAPQLAQQHASAPTRSRRRR